MIELSPLKPDEYAAWQPLAQAYMTFYGRDTGPRVNGRIRANEIRLIGPEGQNVGNAMDRVYRPRLQRCAIGNHAQPRLSPKKPRREWEQHAGQRKHANQ